MKKSLLTLVLFSVICFGSKAGKVKAVKEKEVVKTVKEAVVVEEPTVVANENTSTATPEGIGCNRCRKHREDRGDSKEGKRPFSEVAYSEVKDGETYLIIKKYVKGENDPEDITPETIVVLKPSNE